MPYASHHAMRRIQRIKAAPGMTADEQDQAIRDFIDSGQVKHITTADVIAHHDEMNRRRTLIPSAVRPR